MLGWDQSASFEHNEVVAVTQTGECFWLVGSKGFSLLLTGIGHCLVKLRQASPQGSDDISKSTGRTEISLNAIGRKHVLLSSHHFPKHLQ